MKHMKRNRYYSVKNKYVEYFTDSLIDAIRWYITVCKFNGMIHGAKISRISKEIYENWMRYV